MTFAALMLFVTLADPKGPPTEAELPETPLRLRVWLDFAPHPRFPASYRQDVAHEFEKESARLLGEAWHIEFAEAPAGHDLESPPAAAALAPQLARADKLLWIQIDSELSDSRPDRLPVALREFDGLLEEWGPVSRREMLPGPRLASELFVAARRQVRPVVQLTSAEGARFIRGVVRGLALAPRDSAEPYLRPGQPFQVVREFFVKGVRVKRTEVPWTYVLFRESTDYGYGARFEVMSGLRSPLTGRTRQKSRLLAIGVGPFDDGQTIVRFITGKDQRPVAGFNVSVRPQDQSSSVSVGNTDHRGEVVVRPVRLASEQAADDATRVLQVTLRADRYVLATFPMIPGEKTHANIRVQLDPQLTDTSGRVLALQEEMLDAIARRLLLMRRLDKFVKDNKVAEANQVAAEINALPDRAFFQKRLDEVKQLAMATPSAARPSAGPGIQRLFLQTENLLSEQFRQDKVSLSVGTVTEPDKGAASEKPGPTSPAPADKPSNPAP